MKMMPSLRDIFDVITACPVRALFTFLDNRRVLKYMSRPERGPLGIVFNLTSRCDARCAFCGHWKKSEEGGRELTEEEKRDLLGQFASCGVSLISFCGGEPLLPEGTGALIRTAKRRRMVVNISTNGSLLAREAPVLVEAGVDSVTVSVDSHDPAIHDRMRGYPGLFKKIEEGISEVKRLRKVRRPLIRVRCLLSAVNCYSLDAFMERWGGEADEIVFKPVHGTRDGIFSIPEEMRIAPGEKERFIPFFRGLLEKYPSLDTPYHRAIPAFLFGGAREERDIYCLAGTFYGDVDSRGRVYACAETGRSFGDASKGSFLDIWRSDALMEFRRELKASGRCPRCWGDKFSRGLRVLRVLEMMGGI